MPEVQLLAWDLHCVCPSFCLASGSLGEAAPIPSAFLFLIFQQCFHIPEAHEVSTLKLVRHSGMV